METTRFPGRTARFTDLRVAVLVAPALLAWIVPAAARADDARVFTRAELLADAEQLAASLEEAHPDPYVNGGGKVAFHRRLDDLLGGIPAGGMTKEQFYRRLLPFVAALRDGHTAVLAPEPDGAPRPGLPIAFRIVEESLVVAGTPPAGAVASGGRSAGADDLLGAVLVSVEGIPMPDLVARQNALRGIENASGTLALLSRGLKSARRLATLVPEWRDETRIRAAFRLASGETREVSFEPGPPAASAAGSRVELPDTTKSDVAWRFLDGAGKTAILEITDMSGYREACEAWLASGMSQAPEFVHAAYAKFHAGAVPKDMAAVLAGIPAATEVFTDLVTAMARRKTQSLIVDVRDNGGGHDLMVPMLVAFLFGRDAMMTYDQGYVITKYSPLFFRMYTAIRLEDINRGRDLPLSADGYDFAEERGRGRRRDAEVLADLKKVPTFYRPFEKGLPTYRPPKLVVLSSSLTYSAGYSMVAALERLGATVVGTPSAQAGNAFVDSLLFRLQNTQLDCAVSFKQNVTYPDDAAKGRCLVPHVLLTYDKLAELHFDPNAEVLLALETLGRSPAMPR